MPGKCQIFVISPITTYEKFVLLSGLITDYQSIFSYPHFAYGQKTENSYQGNCVLSKYPIVSCFLVPFDMRKSMRMMIDAGKPLYLDVIHPFPFIEEQKKIAGVKRLLERMRTPYVLTGDFNTLSDEDEYHDSELREGFRKFTTQPGDKESSYFLERRVIPFIRSYGLRDAMPKERRTYTIPTDSQSHDKSAAMRLDYCFVSPNVRVIDSYILQGGDAEIGSDHRPIVTIIDF